MALQGNAFALLEGDDGENLLARASTAATVKAEVPPSAVDKRRGNHTKPPASSHLSVQSSSAPQRSLDHEKGRQNRNGVERQNRNGVERHSRNGIEVYHNRNGGEANDGHDNGSQQNNRGRRPFFKRGNGYRHDEVPTNGVKRVEGSSNGHQKKEEATNGDSNGHQKEEVLTEEEGGWQTVVRPNSHRQSKANHRQAPRDGEGNVASREGNYGRRRGINNGNGSEVVFEDKQHHEESVENGVSGDMEKLNDNESKNGTVNRMRNGSSGANGRVSRGIYQRRRVEGMAEVNGKTSESKGLTVKEEGLEGDETSSKGGDSSKRMQDKVPSKEEIEKLEWEAKKKQERKLEAKKMTLQQYKGKFEEKRKVLESMKAEERRVAPDKDFNSMYIIAKKNEEEADFLKINSASDKQKKKAASNKDDSSSRKLKKIIILDETRCGGRYPRRDDDRNGGSSGRPEGSGNGSDALTSVGKAALPLPSFEDSRQFPALGLDGK